MMVVKYAWQRLIYTGSFICSANASPRLKRSEEHTSELQSRLHLVCRLLLEKKNLEDALEAALLIRPWGDRADADELGALLDVGHGLVPALLRAQLVARAPQ